MPPRSTPDARHVILSNRAAAYLALQRHQEALDDCLEVIQLNKSFAKGYLRAAQALKGLKRTREALDMCKRGMATAASQSADAGSDRRPVAGYPELTRLAHALNTELAKKPAPPAGGGSAARSEHERELIKEYNELVEDVENLNAVLERKFREVRMLEITASSLDKMHEEEQAPPRTFVPIGRMFIQKPLADVQAELKAQLDRANKDMELGRDKMRSSEQRLKEMSKELEEIMGRAEGGEAAPQPMVGGD
jgi:chaperonin cofactor prefoldin